MSTKRVFGIDIETTGLNPLEDRVVTIAMAGEPGVREVIDMPDNERSLLWKVGELMEASGRYGNYLVGWNHTEFDLPFLAVRYALWGIGYMGPTIKPLVETGKYGKPRYTGTWRNFWYQDMAYQYETTALRLDVKWSLKPLTDALGYVGVNYDIDFDGQGVLGMSVEDRKQYCLSDVDRVMWLYNRWVHRRGPSVLVEPTNYL